MKVLYTCIINVSFLALIQCLAVIASLHVHQDEIIHMPDVVEINFRQYAGYLDTQSPRKIFYWFQESQNDPKNDPIILWLQGGPRCSGSLAAVWLHGAFQVHENGSISLSKYSWNKVANMLYIDYPAGTGLSYTEDGNFTTTDFQAADDNMKAVQNFFTKFPQFSTNAFYIFGESWGGKQTYYLAYLLMINTNINIQGAGSGNGLIDTEERYKSYFKSSYMFSHSIIGLNYYRNLVKACCHGLTAKTLVCSFAERALNNSVCNDTHEKYLHVQDVLGSVLNVEFVNKECPGGVPGAIDSPCLFRSVGARIFYNRPDVRAALHVKPGLPKWIYCWPVDVRRINFTENLHSVIPQLEQLLKQGKRILLFYGDSDSAAPFTQGEMFAEHLGKNVTGPYRAWFYPDDGGKQQIGGFTQQWGLLTFVTVKGTGHMSTLFAKAPELHMISQFLRGDAI